MASAMTGRFCRICTGAFMVWNPDGAWDDMPDAPRKGGARQLDGDYLKSGFNQSLDGASCSLGTGIRDT